MKTSLGAKTVVCPTPVFVVGTYDVGGRPNVMTVAWGGICCSKPPCIAISVRKATYTYGNLAERKEFAAAFTSAAEPPLLPFYHALNPGFFDWLEGIQDS